MRIIFFEPGAQVDLWLEELRVAVPNARVENWAPGVAAADYAVAWAPPQQLIDEQPGLKALFNIGAGVDRLLQLRLPSSLPLVRLDDAGMGVQMAEYVCHALIRHFREFATYGQQAAQGQWTQRTPRSRSGFPVGIMGLGALGEKVALAVQQFEFPVVGWSRTPRQIAGVRCFSGPAGFNEFLAATKVLVCLLPLTPETQDVLCHASLSRLQVGAFVINVARGGLLVEDDLLALVDSGHLAGAMLDVFRTEPLPVGHPFWRHPKIQITPHTSAQTMRDQSIAQIAKKIIALERGEPIAGLVDRTRGY